MHIYMRYLSFSMMLFVWSACYIGFPCIFLAAKIQQNFELISTIIFLVINPFWRLNQNAPKCSTKYFLCQFLVIINLVVRIEIKLKCNCKSNLLETIVWWYTAFYRYHNYFHFTDIESKKFSKTFQHFQNINFTMILDLCFSLLILSNYKYLIKNFQSTFQINKRDVQSKPILRGVRGDFRKISQNFRRAIR